MSAIKKLSRRKYLEQLFMNYVEHFVGRDETVKK